MELCPKLRTQEFLPQHIDPSQCVAYLAQQSWTLGMINWIVVDITCNGTALTTARYHRVGLFATFGSGQRR